MSRSSTLVPPHIARSIDVVRGAAGLGVIWSHAIYSLPAKVELNGAFWVWIFFGISGYLVGRGFIGGGYELTPQGFARFLKNRALRILPLAFIAMAIGLLGHLAAGVPVPETALLQFLFIPPLNDMSLSGPLWSVAVEMQFYVLAALLAPLVALVWRYGRIPGAVALVIACVLLGKLWIGFADDNPVQPRTLFGNLAFFILGLMLAHVEPLRYPNGRKHKALAVGLGVALVWWLCNFKDGYFWRWGNLPLPLGGGAAIAMVIVAAVLVIDADERSDWIPRPLAVLRWCGFYCYGIYVWHSVLATLNNLLWKIPPGIGRLALLMLAVPLAPLSYKLIEAPVLRFKKSRAVAAAGSSPA
jgi:peptidoglycan/LPS O-acetylase OafA/YrhL